MLVVLRWIISLSEVPTAVSDIPESYRSSFGIHVFLRLHENLFVLDLCPFVAEILTSGTWAKFRAAKLSGPSRECKI